VDTEDTEDIFSETEINEDPVIVLDENRLNAIRAAFKASDAGTKAKVKVHLAEYGNRLSDTMKQSDVDAIESVLGLSEEV
jgi:hypothetical protein